MLTKKLRFFGERSPLELVYIGAFENIFGSVNQQYTKIVKVYPKIVQRGDPLGQQGVESLRGGASACMDILILGERAERAKKKIIFFCLNLKIAVFDFNNQKNH